MIVGAPEFVRGDETVLFLKTHGDDLPDVFGLNQGVFRVRIDSATGQTRGRAAGDDGCRGGVGPAAGRSRSGRSQRR